MKSAPVARVVLALALVAGVGVVTEASNASATDTLTSGVTTRSGWDFSSAN